MRRLPTTPSSARRVRFGILDAEARSCVVAEVEFGEVAVQMRLADAVIDAGDSALDDREERLAGVDADVSRPNARTRWRCGSRCGARRTLSRFADRSLLSSVIKNRCAVDVGDDQRAHALRRHVRVVEALGAAVALDHAKNGLLRRRSAGARGYLALPPM